MSASPIPPGGPLSAARLLASAASIACLAAGPASGDEIRLPPPGSDAWSELSFRSVRRTTQYTPDPGPGDAAVRAESRCAASGLFLPLPDVDLTRTPILAWRWQVERGLEIAEERIAAGDDFAARVFVLFRFEPERASFAERMRHRFGSLLYDPDPPGSALEFVWASRAPIGESWKSPRTPSARIVVQATGVPDAWREERVDIPAGYARVFGHAPPDPLGVALMTDSDDTCQRAAARYGDFRFLSGDP